ncbi:hypothetical protein [Endozoicomonas sp. ONNA1]|uniref:hypothetical protein n=1 Tax=Endozoicomonas sp. ONNA1 TaxID=2828740 RepID=UPI00214890D6|nr:hypothetical protein [Endozoicomonas sp. ONNA1]
MKTISIPRSQSEMLKSLLNVTLINHDMDSGSETKELCLKHMHSILNVCPQRISNDQLLKKLLMARIIAETLYLAEMFTFLIAQLNGDSKGAHRLVCLMVKSSTHSDIVTALEEITESFFNRPLAN